MNYDELLELKGLIMVSFHGRDGQKALDIVQGFLEAEPEAHLVWTRNQVEYVARAICQSFYLDGGNQDDDGWGECTNEMKEQYTKAARAAIKAYRAHDRAGFKLD